MKDKLKEAIEEKTKHPKLVSFISRSIWMVRIWKGKSGKYFLEARCCRHKDWWPLTKRPIDSLENAIILADHWIHYNVIGYI